MSFDTQTRNRLASFVGKCRALLCGDFKSPGGEMARQLAHYGIQDTGKFFEVDTLTHLDEPGRETARTLRSILAHKQASAPAAKVWKKFDAAVYDLIQEQGFTVLNRLCALRMAEERKILEFPCISKGLQSDGFELYEYHSGKANAAISKEDRFQHFVFSLFDELSLDLGSLFDRFSPQGLLFPAPQALGELLDLINDPALAHLWAEDETIGWIYQYWNSKEERKAMRDASAAPRNSRELAVRNQFFTPRYVVQFLTDNTLGRIWYEMTQGCTGLVDQCEYLVRRPNEIFLADGEVASAECEVISEEALTQEELLKQPVYIPFRPLKDPREIRLLDPACGSMHFGLYAFDLFEKIYSEFWDLESAENFQLKTENSHARLTDRYASKEAYLIDVPKMIIENNVHGIDIDPRAAQIAGLALWLRAQRSWQSAGLLATQRPKVERSNIVCAEPMPGDKEQLGEFTAQLHPAIARMVEAIFEKMQLAGEAGSLLKIEEEITTLVDDAKAAWKQIGKHEGEMFSAAELVNADRRTGTQTQLDIGSWNLETLSAISDSDFFEQAEQSIYQALARYAESATQGSYKRKLFAHDAAQGFAFIDLCRKRYDVAVMNPPFGKAQQVVTIYLKKEFPRSYYDIYTAFIERFTNLLGNHGFLGCITSKTFFANSRLRGLRNWLLDAGGLTYCADLGQGVLDGATVETAASIIFPGHNSQSVCFFNATSSDRAKTLHSCAHGITEHVHRIKKQLLWDFPNQSFAAYWGSASLLSIFNQFPKLDPIFADTAAGQMTGDDFRFVRSRWEPPIQHSDRWFLFAKGGEFFRYYSDWPLLVDWTRSALIEYRKQTVRSVLISKRSDDFIDRPAMNWNRVNEIGFNVRAMPVGAKFADKAPAVFPKGDCLALLGILCSRLMDRLCALQNPNRMFEVRDVSSLPIPPDAINGIEAYVAKIVKIKQFWSTHAEPSTLYVSPWLGRQKSIGIYGLLEEMKSQALTDTQDVFARQSQIDHLVEDASGLSPSDNSLLVSMLGDSPSESILPEFGRNLKGCTAMWFSEEILSFGFGSSFGRWDIRYATGEREAPELPDPFDPLPVCPPGMLQNESGLPLSMAELTELNAKGSYPLRVSIDGILVDDAGHPSEDIVARVRDALAVIWGERSGAIEQEACDILKVKELRDYFSEGKSGGKFFKDHLKRYSKSRRKAPIYWPISTESGDYTLWFYYHRLSEDSLYTAVTQFIVPRQEEAAATFARLGAKQERSKAEDKELESAQTLVAELATLKDSLLEIAKFWKPNLNDGVQITAAPLWKHFRLGAWQKVLKDTWSQLQKGEYDWAHLAHSTWPERVIHKCTTDRSLAIAHGHEQALWEEVKNDKGKIVWQPKKDAKEVAEELVRQC